MKTFNCAVIEVDNDYNNEKKITDTISLVVNTTIESVEHINRIGKVVSTPDGTILQEGDEVIIHHNICRLRNDTKGKVAQSNYWLKDKLYFVPLTEIFMYRRNGEDWKAIYPYCFVKPIPTKSEKEVNGLLVYDSEEEFVPNEGYITYPNELLIDESIEKDDHVVFSNDSEYKFIIDGELYYKMSYNDILGKKV